MIVRRNIAESGGADQAEARLNARFDELAARLDRIEASLRTTKDVPDEAAPRASTGGPARRPNA